MAQTLPRTSVTVGEWIEKRYGVGYTRSALSKLLHRLDIDYRKPTLVPRKLDPAKQQAFIAAYDDLLNTMGDDEAVLFADAVHPTHEVRPAGCWAPKDMKVAVEQTSGRQRLNIHGAAGAVAGWALHPLESAAFHGAHPQPTLNAAAIHANHVHPQSRCLSKIAFNRSANVAFATAAKRPSRSDRFPDHAREFGGGA